MSEEQQQGKLKTAASLAAISTITPKTLLLPYQRRWVDDKSRFKIGLWARQTGKDFSTSAEAVEDCMLNPKTLWVILASGERQALESMAKAKDWAKAFEFAIAEYAEARDAKESLIKSAEILFANGSRLIALPANPDTARGYSGNLILTEFAFHDDPDAIWRAIYPSITNPLRGGEKKIRIISTPNGKGNKFYDLWTKAEAYSRHKVTIHDAVAQGLPINVEELRRGLDDPEGWAQEYELEFIDGSAVLLPYEVIALCESPDASESVPDWPMFHQATPVGRRFCGIDFGRKRDLTVCWTLEKVGDVLWTREVLVLSKMSTPDQVEALKPRIQGAQRVCLDYTGAGVGLGDYLVKEFQEWNPEQHQYGRIELCQFTPTLKADIFSKLRMRFDERRLRIPVSRTIREDLHAIQRVTTPNGISYRAPHTEDGHSDRATALALGVRAASDNFAVMRPIASKRGTRAGRAIAARRDRTVTG